MSASSRHEDFPHTLIKGRPARETRPDMELENQLVRSGRKLVAGVDEAGRGPLAGPVVAAAVVLNPDALPKELDDSKRLSARQRNKLHDKIMKTAHVAISTIANREIDATDIRAATLECMSRAVHALETKVDWVLVDGRDAPPDMADRTTAVIKGDRISMSVAAASIVAKVARDLIMVEAARAYPVYGFERHKGYGTPAHREAIARHGPCPLHRLSFSPFSNALRVWP